MHPHLCALASSQGGVFTHGQAVSVGYSPSEIKRYVESGRWRRVRRGVLVEATVHEIASTDPRSLHLLHGAAVLAVTGREAWLSHHTAALAWGLPLLGPVPDDVAVTVAHQHRRTSPGVEFHTARTPPRHRAVAAGLAVTSVARTVSDLARSRPFGDAVVAADAALFRRACTTDDLEAVIADCPVWPGIARTKRVLAFADRRSESPGESVSRVALAAAGLPAPDLQVELLLGGRHVRVDFMWPRLRLVGEFDGRVKYGEGRDLWLEKEREDLIRRHDHGMARWVWRDAYPQPAAMLSIVRTAMRDRSS